MSERLPVADALAELARADRVPAIAPEDALSMIDRAIDASDDRAEAEAEPDPVLPRRGWAWYAAAAAALLLVSAGIWASWPEPEDAPVAAGAPSAATTRLTLPGGDALAVTPGARFELERTGDRRRVRVSRGSVSFDVRPLEAGESFEVVTPHLTARVVGTVFTVESRSDASIVRVYEGRVEVTHDGEREMVRAGAALAVGPGDGGSEDPLAEVAREAARTRERAREASSASLPHVAAPAPAPDTATATATAPGTEPGPGAGAGAGAGPGPGPGTGPGTEPPTLDDARRWIAQGDPARALAIARTRSGAPWRLVEGDALRAAGRFAEAVEAYVQAARDPSARLRAGYLIATTRAEHLSDRRGALEALDRYGCAAEGSPLAERALVLRARLWTDLGRGPEAARAAEEYLRRFPRGPHRDDMGRLR